MWSSCQPTLSMMVNLYSSLLILESYLLTLLKNIVPPLAPWTDSNCTLGRYVILGGLLVVQAILPLVCCTMHSLSGG